MNTNFFEHETIPQNSTISPVENLAVEVSDAFTRLSTILSTSSILPSFSSVIGSYTLLDINYHGFEEDYTESFSLEDSTKDIVLSTEPTDIISVSYLNATTNSEVYLSARLNAQEFTDKNQYKVIGKVLSLSSDFTNITLKVKYKGIRKAFGNLNLRPNIIKNTNNSYLVSLQYKGGLNYSLTYDINLSTNLEKIFGSNVLDPSKIYLLIKDGDEYRNVPFSSVYESGETLNFTLEDQLDDNYQAVVYVSNITISEFLSSFYKEFLNHSHTKDASENLINHSDLLDLYKNTSTIFYKDLGIVNYDHPQYLNREGYNSSLTAVYENALLGDLFLASKITENDQQYKTLLKNSNSILFGDPVRGSKIYFDAQKKVINLLSGNNLHGLNIEVGSEQKALLINNTSYIQEGSDGLTLAGKGDIVRINPLTEAGTSTFIADNIEANDSIQTPSLKANEINVGNVLVSKEADNIHIGLKDTSVSAKLITSVTAEFADLNADHFNASTILVGDSDKIEIDSENYLTKHEHGFEITSEGPTKFVTSGLRTGLAVGKNDALSFNVYTADYLGQQSSILDTNVYLETPTQTETYLLQSTTERVNYGPNTYKFQGEPESGVITIENLKEWRRANLNAGNINSYSLTLKTSDGVKKNGLIIGDTKISSIGTGLDCPAGMTLIESSDTVSIIKPLPADEVECSDVNYQGLNAGATQIFGMLSVDDSILAVENITAGESLISRSLSVSESASLKTLNVQDETILSGTAEFNGFAKFLNRVEIVGSTTIDGSVDAMDLEIENYASIGGTLTVEGQSILKNNVIIEGALSTSAGFTTIGPIQSDSLKTGPIEAENIKAVGGIDVEGRVNLTGPTTVDGSLQVNGNTLVQGSFEATSELTTNSLYVTDSTVIGGRLTVQDSTILEGSNISIGTSGSTVTITGTLQLDATTTTFTGAVRVFKQLDVAENLKVSGDIYTSSRLSGTTLDVSAGATIGGLLKADSGEFNRKTYFVEGLKANSDSEFTRIRSSEATLGNATTTTLFVNDQLTMGPDSTLKTENLVTSDFSQTSASAEVTFGGNVKFFNPVTFTTKLIVGNPAIESGRNTSGVLITDREITMGNNSTLKATKIFATKGLPVGSDADKNAGFCFESASNNGGTDGDTGFFATAGTGAVGSDLEFWIDGDRKALIPKQEKAYNATTTPGETIVTIKILKDALSDMTNKMSQLSSSLGDRFWPVGSIYMTMDNRNPYTILGFGTWIRFAPGRTLVGTTSADAGGQISGGLEAPAGFNLNSAGQTYGEFSHVLTTNEIPKHSHKYNGDDMLRSSIWGADAARVERNVWYDAKSNGSHQGGVYLTSDTGNDAAHNNVQPSITVNMWQRLQ